MQQQNMKMTALGRRSHLTIKIFNVIKVVKKIRKKQKRNHTHVACLVIKHLSYNGKNTTILANTQKQQQGILATIIKNLTDT